MSQEGANLPQEVEGSHDKATAPHGSIPAGVGSPTTTVMPSGSNSSSIIKQKSDVNNAGSSKRASPAVLSAGEDNNDMSTKIAGPMVLLAGEKNKLASPAMLLAGEEKGSGVGDKLASPASKVGSHAGMDNNATQSKLASPTVLHACDGNNGGSKITSPAVPHTSVDNTTGSKLDNPAVLYASEGKSVGFKLPNPAVLHSSKDMESNAGRSKFTSPVLLHVGEDNKAKNKLAIQAVPHVGGNARSFRLTRSAAALHVGKDKNAGSKLAIQVVPRPHAGKGKNIGSSKAARPAVVDADESNAKEGKNNIAGEQLVHEADMGGSSGKGNATAAEDGDHDLHIFTERERRKKMKNMFSTLHGLLPQLPDKADKATIVGEAVTYIKALEGTLEKLEKVKLERKRALAAQQQAQQQQQLVVGAGGSSSHSSSARHPAPALPAPAPAALSREAALADMVHSLEVQQATVDAANRALAAAAAAATAGAGGSSSAKRALAAAGAGGSSSSAAALALPRGPVPFPAPAVGFQTWSGHNVVVSVANNEAYINLQCPREPGMLTKALFVLERHRIEVVTTTISAQDGFRMYGIHARANPASSAEASFPVNLCAEDRFKLAVSEMLQLINL